MSRGQTKKLSHFLGLAIGFICNMDTTFRKVRDKISAYRVIFFLAISFICLPFL